MILALQVGEGGGTNEIEVGSRVVRVLPHEGKMKVDCVLMAPNVPIDNGEVVECGRLHDSLCKIWFPEGFSVEVDCFKRIRRAPQFCKLQQSLLRL